MKTGCFAVLLACLALVGSLAGCQSQEEEQLEGGEPYVNQQLVEPTGPKAVIETSMGNITVALFPQEAPKAVENFLTHAREGYYDGLTFHRVINDFMIQGGDPNGNGTGGESIWGQPFEDEFSDGLHHFPGALSMANSGVNTNGSQFFIVQNATPIAAADTLSVAAQWYYNMLQRELDVAVAQGNLSQDELQALVDSLNAQLQEAQQNGLPEEFNQRFAPALEQYQQVGGTYYLDYKHTVFGQVVAGMDVVNAIAQVETDQNDRPVEEVTILRITVLEEDAG